MAEAVVENRPPPVRFFCHKCNIEFEHVLQDYTCPFCAMGFIEKLEEREGGVGGQHHMSQGGGGVGAHQDELSNNGDRQNRRPHQHDHMMMMDHDMAVLDDSYEDAAQDSGGNPWARWQPPWNYRDPNAPPSDMPQFVNLNEFAFLLQDTQSGAAPPSGSRLLQLVQQVVLGGEPGGRPLVVVGRHHGGGGPLGGEYVMSGELDAIMSQLLWQAESEGPPPLPQQAIASLPEVSVSPEQVQQGLQCSICWETFITDEKVRELSCGHVYHQGCITPWLSLHATCPICRKSLAPPPSSASPQDQAVLQQQHQHSQLLSHSAGTDTPSLAFLFRGCGLPTTSSSNTNNTSNPGANTSTDVTNDSNTTTPLPNSNNEGGATANNTAPPRGSMSELLNQLVSMSGALALNFSMGGGAPTITTTTNSMTTPPASNTGHPSRQGGPRAPPPPSNYDDDMEFD